MKTIISAALLATAMATSPALAQSNGHAGHGGHDMGGAMADVKAAAVIHKVDAGKGMINVTHEPVPQLKWPKMTMDLPVTRRVDLSKVKAGDKVMITLKQGMDKQYRVVEIAPEK
ncbi:MAG: copper-binding protein [Hyphomicrobiaceae bacterium]